MAVRSPPRNTPHLSEITAGAFRGTPPALRRGLPGNRNEFHAIGELTAIGILAISLAVVAVYIPLCARPLFAAGFHAAMLRYMLFIVEARPFRFSTRVFCEIVQPLKIVVLARTAKP
jgi:hypothetical protein